MYHLQKVPSLLIRNYTLSRSLSVTPARYVVPDGHTPSVHEKFHDPHKILSHPQDLARPTISFHEKLILSTLRGCFLMSDVISYLPNKFMGKEKHFEILKNKPKAININPSNPAGPWRDPLTVNSDLVLSAYPGVLTAQDLWKRAIKKFGKLEFLGERKIKRIYIHKNREGVETQLVDFSDYKWKTYEEVDKEVTKIRKALYNMGFKKGDRILFFADTRPEWITCALACINSGIEIVTAYPTLGKRALKYILYDTKIKHIVSAENCFETLNELLADDIKIENLIYFKDKFRESSTKKNRPAPIHERKRIPKNILKQTDVIVPYDKLFDKAKNEIKLPYVKAKPEDLCIIMYTSGSTGTPKAAEITHQYIISNISGWKNKWNVPDNEKAYIAYLPLSHIMELIGEMYNISVGARLAFSSPLTLVTNGPKLKPGVLGDLVVSKPHFLPLVPMIMNRIKKAVDEKLLGSSVFKQNLFTMCYNRKLNKMAQGLGTPILDKIIFKNTSAVLGGNVERIAVGSAPLDVDVQRFIQVTMNTAVLQGYGLTECVAVSVCDMYNTSVGHCGSVTSCCELLLRPWEECNYYPTNKRPQGEILISGPGVIKRYFKNRNEDSFVDIDGKRWFCTGDIGEILEDGTLKIIDRKKGLKKLNNGEFISLAAVEGQLLTNQYVDQVCVVVDSKLDYCVALIVANKKNVEELGEKLGLKLSFEELVKHKGIRTVILYNIEETLENKLTKYEIPKKLILVTEPFTVENGLLTAAMKLKRIAIENKYKDLIKIIYKAPVEYGEIPHKKVIDSN
uniref:long-chain-fatty-acid--CoA ligase n=1 Tax=Parastrongyloides trichosuri TaxID=131310 RepID=A0A0N4Z6F0_PARTI